MEAKYWIIFLIFLSSFYELGSKYYYNSNGIFYSPDLSYALRVRKLPNETIVKVQNKVVTRGYVYYDYNNCYYSQKDPKQFGLLVDSINVSLIVTTDDKRTIDICLKVKTTKSRNMIQWRNYMFIADVLSLIKIPILILLLFMNCGKLHLVKLLLFFSTIQLISTFFSDWLLIVGKHRFYDFVGLSNEEAVNKFGLPRTMIDGFLLFYMGTDLVIQFLTIILIFIYWGLICGKDFYFLV
uniref:PKD_channel domain-containing protein n=1 Tax=Parastrongyloides trichosuri TaxID=131310 RepID=A0A0N4ZJT3_PARTI